MQSTPLWGPILVVSGLAACLSGMGLVPAADAASSALPRHNPSESAKSVVIEIKKRRRASGFITPIAPSYLYYEYSYYYSRGRYPTHIKPGFIYYGYPYAYYVTETRPGYSERCSIAHSKCVAGWLRFLDPKSSRRRKAR